MDPTLAPPALRIFVAVASYRDRETQWTVEDLFDRAEHPERVTVGICWQLEPEDEAACFERPYPRPSQVIEKRIAVRDRRGRAWARAQALALAAGEEFVLMIDSRTRFAAGWDSALIAALANAPGTRAALTGWLPGYGPPRTLQPAPPGQTWLIGARELTRADDPSVLRLGPVAVLRDTLPPLTLTPFLVADFLFARRDLFAEVPLDPHIEIDGQALALSARLWTHGYTLWQPRDAVLFHHRHAAAAADEDAGERVARSARRVRHLLGLERSDDAAALAELERFGHGRVRRLDDLWLASGVDPRRGAIAEVARQGRWNQSPQRAPASGPRIFVSIPSYRDAETQWTVKDLYAKAARPERVFVGIFWQFVAGQDADCFVEPCPRPEQVRMIEIAAEQSEGSCWARAQALSLWRGEEYVLAIDAHTRFEPGWDESLLDMLARCPSANAVLTTYPNDYTGRDDCDRNGILKMAFKEFVVDVAGLPPRLAYDSVRILPASLPERPFPTALVSVNFLFARSELFSAVPFDPHVYFYDDLPFAARAWTSGWDFYSPNRTVLFHLWDRSKRPGHWDDQPASVKRLRERTRRRVSHLVGVEPSADADALAELDRYGLGNVRSIAEYEAFSGVDFKRRIVSERARRGEVGAAGAASVAPRRFAPVLRSTGAIVIDDFLSEAEYRELFEYTTRMDYQYINTTGTVRRVWDLSSGFPLRSEKNLFVHAPHATTREGNFHYPSGTPLDRFVDAIHAALPDVGGLVGLAGPEGWNHFSVTSWIYPPNTALSMHDDGAGVYSGAYVYYLNPEWKPHWGGLLIVLDDEANRAIAKRQDESDGQAFYAKKWLHLGGHDELALEHGLGRCIFPKRNRIVFIAPDAYHLVTRVLPEAGDNVRMSLAGFFHRRPSTPGTS